MKKIKLWIKHVLLNKKNVKIGLSSKLLALKKGFSSYFFKLYNLNKNNIDDYISEYSRYLSREIDGEYKIMLDDKIIFTEVFGQYINVPKIIMYNIGNIYSREGKVLKRNEILKILKSKKVVIKPINDGGGHGVHVIEENKNKYYIDYLEKSEDDVYNLILSSKNTIVNEYISQAKYANDIYDKAVNTIRIITIKNPKTGEISIPCAVHRFGNSKTGGVDNASSGGCISEINIKDGELGYTKMLSDLTPRKVHPNTNNQIKGVKIPNWKKIKKEIINVANKFPYLNFIAWDVVVTDNGLYVLEANASSSLELFQIFKPLKNTELWEFYKYYNIIKK